LEEPGSALTTGRDLVRNLKGHQQQPAPHWMRDELRPQTTADMRAAVAGISTASTIYGVASSP